MQSYQNVSNSQLNIRSILCLLCCKRLCKVIKMLAIHNLRILNKQKGLGCKRLCKVIKMLAIHNQSYLIYIIILVANAYAKLSKCQQFTTLLSIAVSLLLLQTLMQSYQNVSNSQRGGISSGVANSCKRLCKVIKMLAIHNLRASDISLYSVANAYAKLSKCQQFTTDI